MGNVLSRSEPFKVLLVGPLGTGKSSIMYCLKHGALEGPIGSTLGFNTETIEHRFEQRETVKMTLWDSSDRNVQMRSTWPRVLYPGAQGVIFVVDAADCLADPAQLVEAEGLLEFMMQDEAIRGLPLLLLANKSDLLPPGEAITAASKLVAAVPALDRHSVESRSCSAIDGMYSVSQGLTWLAKQMRTMPSVAQHTSQSKFR